MYACKRLRGLNGIKGIVELLGSDSGECEWDVWFNATLCCKTFFGSWILYRQEEFC